MKRDESLYPIPIIFTCLLPPIVGVGTILGDRPVLPWMLKLMSAQVGLPLPVHQKTAALGHRMSRGSWSKVRNFLHRCLESIGIDALGEMLDTERPLSGDESPNAMCWRAAISGMCAVPGASFPAVRAYVERMCDRERELVRFALAHPTDALALMERYRETLVELTAIPDACIEAGFEQAAAARRQGQPQSQTPEAAVLGMWMHWDSILRFAAVAEIDLFEAQSDARSERASVLERLWPVWKDGVPVARPPRRFFELLREAVQGRAGFPARLSWGVLATLRTGAGNAPADGCDPENRRRELLRWRRGQHRPSSDKLSRFLRDLGANESEILDILILCTVAYGIDREVQRTIELFDGPSSTAWCFLAEIFAAYPRYREAARAYGAVAQSTG